MNSIAYYDSGDIMRFSVLVNHCGQANKWLAPRTRPPKDNSSIFDSIVIQITKGGFVKLRPEITGSGSARVKNPIPQSDFHPLEPDIVL